MTSTIGRPRAVASFQAKNMTTTPTATIFAMKRAKLSTGCW
jgi:hypothetical protein